jgi:oligopeptide/dipeptide ABC transporter ATP-binding protein
MDRPKLLELRGLEIAFPQPGGGWQEVVSGVDLDLARGQVLAVIGESGSGKSSILLAIAGLLAAAARVRGSLTLPPDATDYLAPRVDRNGLAGRRVGMIFQHPGLSLNPVLRIGTQLEEVVRAQRRLGRKEAHRVSLELLTRVGIDAPERRLLAYPHQLSGGQKQRVAIAAALAGEPGLLLADEPTTALDAMTQAQILDLLLGLVDATGMGLILVTHDLAVAGAVGDNIALVHEGRIVESGPARLLVERPLHPYGQALAGAALPFAPAGHERDGTPFPEAVVASGPPPAEGCAFAPRCPHAIARCWREQPVLDDIEGRRVACWRAGETIA